MTGSRIAVIDYGMGNLHSVSKALELVANEAGSKAEVLVTADPAVVASAERVVFPGVGAIRDCMAEINRLGIGPMLAQALADAKPEQAFQFERQGYFCLDNDVNSTELVFNRTVGLRDTWAKISQ